MAARLDPRGRRGFGHSQDRREIVAFEAALIRDAARRVLAGETLTSIVDDWNRRGIRTTTGGPWRINALSALLIQPRLAGHADTEDGSVEVPPAILDRETHLRLVALRRARRRGPTRSAEEGCRRYLLTGLLLCWRCGSRLTGVPRVGTSAHPHYRCPSRGGGGCSGVSIRADLADEAAASHCLDRLTDPAFAASVEANADGLAAEQEDLVALVTEAIVTEETTEGNALSSQGGLSGPAWQRLRSTVEAAMRTHSRLASRVLIQRQKDLVTSAAALRQSWGSLDRIARRDVIEATVEHFQVLSVRAARDASPLERLRPVWRQLRSSHRAPDDSGRAQPEPGGPTPVTAE